MTLCDYRVIAGLISGLAGGFVIGKCLDELIVVVRKWRKP